MSLQPETADAGSVVNTDLTGASDDTPAGSIFTETEDSAAPAPARPPLLSPEEIKRARLDNVKALAAATRRLTDEQQRYEHDRQKTAHENALLKQEFEALRANPWGYIRDRHGVSAQAVAEAELYPQGEEGRAEKAERIALEVKRQLDGVLNHARTQQETAERVQAWELAKASAVKTFEAGAADKFQNLSAFIDKQAAFTGTSKEDALVSELLLAVDQIKRNPKTAPHAAEYSDLEICEMLEQRYAGFAPAPKKVHSTKTMAPGAVDDDAPTRGLVHGSTAYRRAEAADIVARWKAARGDKPAEERPYSQAQIDAADAKRISNDGRINSAAEALHTRMVVHNAKLAAAAKAGGR